MFNKISKFSVIVLLMVLMASSVIADNLIPVDYDVSIDFSGERDFTLLMPNGYERHFSWDPGSAHSDVTFTHEIYYELNESKYCSNTANYENINNGLVSMLSVCESAISNNNQTTKLSEDLIKCNDNLNVYESDFNAEKLHKETCLKELDDSKTNLLTKTQDLKSCESNLASKTSTASLYTVCKNDLEDQKNSTNKYGFGGLALGVGIGWFVWGRKKKLSASELNEAGNYSDSPMDKETVAFLKQELAKQKSKTTDRPDEFANFNE